MNETQKTSTLSRRTVFAGAGAVGALAAAVAVLPKASPPAEAEPVAAAAQPDDAEGYRLTAHIQRYYQTARV
ncbi:MAG: formate dehydrogenase [Ideonella sp. MAG2]|nr:MAG: formate dehydrogenase [Ideonella sp. MAG2]